MTYNIYMYYQLNTISSYSFYHSTILIEEYAHKAKELGYDGIAVNDDTLFAYPSLAKACQKEGLKAVFGIHIKVPNGLGGFFDASLFIKNETGYSNLCQILAKKEKNYTLPFLNEFKEGLLFILHTSSDFYDDDFLDVFSKIFYQYKKIFQDDFYFGISIYSSAEKEAVSIFYEFTDQNNYQTIAFPKTKYIKKGDAYKTALLEAAESDTEKVEDFPKEGPYFLLSQNALNSIYREKDVKETVLFSNKIDFSFFQKRGQLIKIENENEILKEMAEKGLCQKLHCSALEKRYEERLEYELSVISKMNFSSYFLIVDDYVKFAKKNNIKVGPGRGSAGGSLVAFALDITQIDPLRFDLTFERFLNPYRITMPDIDIDFEDERRNEVILYLKQRYGEERISDIITFVKLKPRSVLNKIGPVLGINENRLKKLTQSISDKANTFQEALKAPFLGSRFQEMLKDPYYNNIIQIANSLLGMPINTSIHAPGAIISENPIYLSCPMSLGKSGTVQFEYPYMEELGFLKVDILSLSNLTFIKKIEEEILKTHNTLPDIYSDLDNEKVYDTLNSLDLVEIFQLDTSFGMKKTISQIRPSCFSDLAACIALFRPGPMDYIPNFANRKHGKEKIQYADERLVPILKETYGILVYQEQIMKALQVLAGFSLGEADLIRRAISKKNKEKMESYRIKFIEGCKENNIEEKKAISIYNDIEKFAEYGFNKSHAYSYGLITYTLLYYKTFFKKEFYVVTLKTESLNSKKITDLIHELKSQNIVLKNPNVNFSAKEEPVFKDNKIYLPLIECIKDDFLLNHILNEREKKQYITFYDFIYRNHDAIKDLKQIEQLIDSGIFDCLSKSRIGMKNVLPHYMNFARYKMRDEDIIPINDDGEDIGEMLYLEKMTLGKILSCSLKQIFFKEGYETYIISDTSSMEITGTITLENEFDRFRIKVNPKETFQKYDFLLIKNGSYNPSKLKPINIINCKRKVVKHE